MLALLVPHAEARLLDASVMGYVIGACCLHLFNHSILGVPFEYVVEKNY